MEVYSLKIGNAETERESLVTSRILWYSTAIFCDIFELDSVWVFGAVDDITSKLVPFGGSKCYRYNASNEYFSCKTSLDNTAKYAPVK